MGTISAFTTLLGLQQVSISIATAIILLITSVQKFFDTVGKFLPNNGASLYKPARNSSK